MSKNESSGENNGSRPESNAIIGDLKRCFCLFNFASGGTKGAKAAQRLRKAGVTAWNLLELQKNPERLEEVARELADCEAIHGRPYIICGGGDGTTSWALQILDRAQELQPFQFLFSVLPLGSGNDLSRCLGWGVTYPGSRNLGKRLKQILDAQEFTLLDRWAVTHRDLDGNETPWQTCEMINYFSMGYEAEIQHEFDVARDNYPETWNSPLKNALKYAQLAISHLMKSHQSLNGPESPIEIVVDGKSLTLNRSTRSIVVNNIPSMAQGVRYWGEGESSPKELQTAVPPAIGDGRFELMSGKSFMSVVKLSAGLGHYHRIAQPKRMEITVKRPITMMIDGESVVAKPGKLIISHKGSVVCPIGQETEPRGVSRPSDELLRAL